MIQPRFMLASLPSPRKVILVQSIAVLRIAQFFYWRQLQSVVDFVGSFATVYYRQDREFFRLQDRESMKLADFQIATHNISERFRTDGAAPQLDFDKLESATGCDSSSMIGTS